MLLRLARRLPPPKTDAARRAVALMDSVVEAVAGMEEVSVQAGEEKSSVEELAATKKPRELHLLASQLFQGGKDADDARKAVALWEVAAERGSMDAQYSLAACARLGALPDASGPQPERSAELLEPLAAEGHPWAAFALGQQLYAGEGVEGDRKRAATLWKAAAMAGLPLAAFNLATLYATGEAVKQDDRNATRWYEKAAKSGHPLAAFNLGCRLIAGRGIDVNNDAGLHWLRQAADNGLPQAAYQLGFLALTGGAGLSRSLPAAERWFTTASDRGFAPAALNLGHMHVRGMLSGGLPAARELYQKAADGGDAGAAEMLEAMERGEDVESMVALPGEASEESESDSAGEGLLTPQLSALPTGAAQSGASGKE